MTRARKAHTNTTPMVTDVTGLPINQPTADVPCHHYATDDGLVHVSATTRALDREAFEAAPQMHIDEAPTVTFDGSRQAFIDQAAIALHARGVPLVNVFRKAAELWDARVAWLKTHDADLPRG